MQNFYTESTLFTESSVIIVGEEYHHATRSCRMKIGELIGVTDGRGKRVEARIETIDSQKLTAVIERDLSGIGEPSVEITVALALIKPSNFEMALEKCTELGARRFVPVNAKRCMVDPARIKIDRLEKIAREAAKQAGRSWVPEISMPIELDELVSQEKGIFFVANRDAEIGIEGALRKVKNTHELALVIGPEGDFTVDELEFMTSGGALPFSLGDLTLRTETAAIAATAIAATCFKNFKSKPLNLDYS